MRLAETLYTGLTVSDRQPQLDFVAHYRNMVMTSLTRGDRP